MASDRRVSGLRPLSLPTVPPSRPVDGRRSERRASDQGVEGVASHERKLRGGKKRARASLLASTPPTSQTLTPSAFSLAVARPGSPMQWPSILRRGSKRQRTALGGARSRFMHLPSHSEDVGGHAAPPPATPGATAVSGRPTASEGNKETAPRTAEATAHPSPGFAISRATLRRVTAFPPSVSSHTAPRLHRWCGGSTTATGGVAPTSNTVLQECARCYNITIHELRALCQRVSGDRVCHRPLPSVSPSSPPHDDQFCVCDATLLLIFTLRVGCDGKAWDGVCKLFDVPPQTAWRVLERTIHFVVTKGAAHTPDCMRTVHECRRAIPTDVTERFSAGCVGRLDHMRLMSRPATTVLDALQAPAAMNKTLSFFVLHGDDGIFRGLSAASLPEDVAHSPHANDSVARLFRRTPLATAVERLAELAIPLHERPDNKLLGHYFVLAGEEFMDVNGTSESTVDVATICPDRKSVLPVSDRDAPSRYDTLFRTRTSQRTWGFSVLRRNFRVLGAPASRVSPVPSYLLPRVVEACAGVWNALHDLGWACDPVRSPVATL